MEYPSECHLKMYMFSKFYSRLSYHKTNFDRFRSLHEKQK